MKLLTARKKRISREIIKVIHTSRDMCEIYGGVYNNITGICTVKHIIDNSSGQVLKHIDAEKMFLHCIVCNKLFESTRCNAKFCSEECRIIHGKAKKRKRKLEIVNPKIVTCPTCGKKITNKRWRNRIYCSDKCRQRKYMILTKSDVIANIQSDFKNLKKINPEKAQKIADEMEIIEGNEFREMTLDGIAPFKNPKIKEHKKGGKI